MLPTRYPTLRFTHPFDEREAFEAHARGYLGFGTVDVTEDRSIPVVFYDSARLLQDLELEAERGRAFIADPGMIVLTVVTRETMEGAVVRLFEEGFFNHFRDESDMRR